QLGGAFGSAIVCAILRHRLASALVSQAQVQASNVPPAYRSQFVQGFAKAANGALEVGRGQSGVALPGNLPVQVRSRILQLGHDVFAQAYLNAMRPALAVAIAVLLIGALLTTGIDRLGDGRMNLLVMGASRFQIVGTADARPYLRGQIRIIPEAGDDLDATARLTETTAMAFQQYSNLLRELVGQKADEAEPPME